MRVRPNVKCTGVTAQLNRRLVMNSSGAIYWDYLMPDCFGDFSAATEKTAPYEPAVELVAEGGGSCGIAAPPPPPSILLDEYGAATTRLNRWRCASCAAPSPTRTRARPRAPFGGGVGTYTGGGYVRDVESPSDCRQRMEATDSGESRAGERGAAARGPQPRHRAAQGGRCSTRRRAPS